MAAPDRVTVGSTDDTSSAAVTEAERAYAEQLRAADRAEDAAWAELARAQGWDDPQEVELESLSPDERLRLLQGPAHEADLLLLADIDPRELTDDLSRARYLQHLDRIAGLVAAMRAEVLVVLAGARPSATYLAEVSVEHEVSVARRTSRYAAGKAISTARALATTFPRFAEALRAGDVSEAHCSVLVDKTLLVADPDVLTRIETRVLPKARRLPVGRFAREAAAAVAALDPDAAGRCRRARSQRHVSARPLDDGLGFLGLVDDWATVSAIKATVDADAQVLRAARLAARGDRVDDADGVDDDALLGPCRADALAARVLGRVDPDGTVTWDPRESVQVNLDLVMDLDTVRREADELALLDGEPLPADLAREWLEAATTWRRVVTDPADGHLLDYGTQQYLPPVLRRYVLARDGGCTAPGCGVRDRRRLQMDHAVEFAQGPSSADNCATLCTTCHQLKTSRRARAGPRAPDGSRTWSTAWGQQVRIPARPFLRSPGPPRAGAARPGGAGDRDGPPPR